MKYLFRRNPYRALEKQLGYSFRRKALLEMALLHRSYRYEAEGVEADNQRLEFLGDAALGLVSAAHLYHTYTDFQEGALSCMRSRLTSGKTLATIGQSLGLGEQLKLGRGEKKTGGHGRASNITDAVEAILGAAFLDGGIKAVEKIFKHAFVGCVEILPEDNWADNPKGRLQQIVQQTWRCNPRYVLVARTGPSHSQMFTVTVEVHGAQAGTGEAHTKREAEQIAAQAAIEFLQTQVPGET